MKWLKSTEAQRGRLGWPFLEKWWGLRVHQPLWAERISIKTARNAKRRKRILRFLMTTWQAEYDEMSREQMQLVVKKWDFYKIALLYYTPENKGKWSAPRWNIVYLVNLIYFQRNFIDIKKLVNYSMTKSPAQISIFYCINALWTWLMMAFIKRIYFLGETITMPHN